MPLRADLRIPDDLGEVVMRHKPSYLSLSSFCLHLIALGVDKDVTLIERPDGSEISTSSNNIINTSSSIKNIPFNNINSTVGKSKSEKPKKAKRPAYTDEFNEFWKLYQSAPDRVSSQTKPKAFDEWKAIVALEGPETLLEAARRAIAEQKRKKTAGEFVGSLPDAFRWLRDGKFEIFLEGHTQQQAGPVWNAELGCWIHDD